jgi:hypothetical protein
VREWRLKLQRIAEDQRKKTLDSAWHQALAAGMEKGLQDFDARSRSSFSPAIFLA